MVQNSVDKLEDVCALDTSSTLYHTVAHCSLQLEIIVRVTCVKKLLQELGVFKESYCKH